MNLLYNLSKLTITDVIAIHDYVQIILEDGSILSLFNKITLLGSNSTIYTIKGCKIISVEQDASSFKLYITNNICVSMNLKSADYNGPEALSLVTPSGNTIVVN